jgi:hypothetical protein
LLEYDDNGDGYDGGCDGGYGDDDDLIEQFIMRA